MMDLDLADINVINILSMNLFFGSAAHSEELSPLHRNIDECRDHASMGLFMEIDDHVQPLHEMTFAHNNIPS